MDEIKIAYDYDDIENKSQDEKLNLLLKIAFANHEKLTKHGDILFGNGKQGLCDMTRLHNIALRWIFTIVTLSICGFSGILFTHLSK